MTQETGEKKESNQGNTTVYKWQAEDGTWKYSDTAQLDRPTQVLSIDPDTNLIPSVASTVFKGDTDGTLYDQHLPSEVSPEKISSLAEEALRVRRLQEARYQDINSLP